MNADLLAVLDYWEKEKGINRDLLVKAVEEALLAAAKRAVGPARELRCEINPKSGEIRAFAKLLVVERVVSKHDQISLAEALRRNPAAKLGDELELEVTPDGFGRIASQYAKQFLAQRIRRIEKEKIFDEFKDRVGDIVTGTVRNFDRSDVIIDLGKFEALLPQRERVPTEEYQVGERLTCYVKAVENTQRGPEIILSRADPNFVLQLFRREVSEIRDGIIVIKAIAREPGFRTKLAVWTRDEKVDPVGACVGLKGQRVKNIVRELNNERVDILRWDPNIKVFITNALSPAKLKTFEIDEQAKRVRILVSEDQYSLAIGKRGQNARLASRLTGWTVDIEVESVKTVGFEEQVEQAIKALAAIPGISPEQARVLVHHGFTTLENLMQAEESDLAEIPELAGEVTKIMEAAKAEAARREIKIGEPSAQ